MAHFVDFGESADIFRPSLKTIFNGFNLDDELTDGAGSFTTLSVSGRNDLEQDITTHEVPGLDGVIEEGNPTLNPRIISVRFRIKDETSTGLQRKLEKLRSLLEGSKRELSFTDDEFFFYATNQTLEIPDETSNSLTSVITFLCSDPYKYGPEKVIGFPSDLVMVNNEGTAEAFPVYEMTVLTPITFAMIQNHLNEALLLGEPSSVNREIISTRNTIFEERGDSLSGWQNPSGTGNDFGVFTGNLTSTGDAISVGSWGTETPSWYGPGLVKEISPIQDFEMESYVYARTSHQNRTFRISVHLFDENLNELGMIRLWDNSRVQEKKVIEGRIGPFVGYRQNYLIEESNYKLVDKTVWGGTLRIKREGNRFTYYAGLMSQGGRHINPVTKTFTDINNQYAGSLKYIQISIQTFGTGVAKPNETRIEYVKVTELSQATVDQTPYIAYPGDIITFDTQTEEILINGEDAMEHKDFISEFFSLKKGENTLGVLPENALDVQMRYKERRK